MMSKTGEGVAALAAPFPFETGTTIKDSKLRNNCIKWYAMGAELKFTYLSLEEAFEYAVLEFEFAPGRYIGCRPV